MGDDRREPARWTFLTNHARVLEAVAREPQIRVRDIAAQCEITERSVGAILADLEQAGYLTKERSGRRNIYRVTAGTHLRHPVDQSRSTAEVLDLSRSPLDGAARTDEDLA